MKYTIVFFLIGIVVLMSIGCSEDDPEIVESFTFESSNGRSITASNPTISFDSILSITTIEFEDVDQIVRLIFAGNNVGSYSGANDVFLDFSQTSNGQQNLETVCDMSAELVINVTSYGDIGEFVIGDYTATTCVGNSGEGSAKGSFSVMREL